MLRFFDLDNTICDSRQVISPQMKAKLLTLEPFVVISGAEIPRIEKQMDGVPCIKMGQNGNDAPSWKNLLTREEEKEIMQHLHKVSLFYFFPIDAETTHNRGCQISFSFTGHNAEISKKKKFDPKKIFRNEVLHHVPFKSKTLIVRVAGNTCLDYNRKGNLKGDNLKRYMKLHNLKKEDCIYLGDAFGKGENDESVKGVMDCVEVVNPQDLLKKLNEIKR